MLILRALIYKGWSGSVCGAKGSFKIEVMYLKRMKNLMQSYKSMVYTDTTDTDMEPPNFDLPPDVEALPTPELRLLALLYMGHRGLLPSLPTSQVVSGDRIQSAKPNAKKNG